MPSLLLWKDDKNYSGFACHLKINRLWTCLDLLALRNQTESTPCTKLWQNKFFFRTFMVGWAFLSFFVCLITGNDFWSIKHFPPLYKIKQRQTLSGLELLLLSVLNQILVVTALWCPRQRWVGFPKEQGVVYKACILDANRPTSFTSMNKSVPSMKECRHLRKIVCL